MRFEDMIPDYPDVSDPQIQRKLNQIPEYSELRGSVREPIPARGEYFKHQRLILLFMREYDRLFMKHELGTGKSCAAKSVASFYKYKYYPLKVENTSNFGMSDVDVNVVGFAEQSGQLALGLPPPDMFSRREAQAPSVGVSAFVDALHEFMTDWDTDIRHAFIIVKGPGLRREFERQITCACADPGEFDFVERAGDTSAETAKRKRRELGKWYTIETSRLFVRRHMCRRSGDRYELLPDEDLKKKFNGCFFFVDEVQALYNEARDGRSTTSTAKRVAQRARSETLEDFEFTYNALDHLFHTIERSKVIVGSGTPMMNNANEIKSPMNLILPLSMRMPRSMKVENMTMEQLEPYFRGRVSYVRELDTGAVVEQKGDHFLMSLDGEEVESSVRVFMSTMGKFQSDVYEKTMRGDFDEIDVVDSSASSPHEEPGFSLAILGNQDFDVDFEDAQAQIMAEIANLQAEMQRNQGKTGKTLTHFQGAEMNASLFVFPDGSLEGKVTEGDGSNMAKSGLGAFVFSPRRGVYRPTAEYLSKINSLEKLRTLSCTYAEILRLLIERPRDKAYIYLGDRVQGAGAINLSVCLEANGFENFRPSSAPAVTSTCGGGVFGRRISIPKKRRFAMITNYTSRAESDAILELYNAPENVHGEYILALIGSTVTGTGLNLMDTKRGHFLPWWNQSGILQAIGRIMRTLSHENLLREERARLASEGGNPDDAFVEVEIYRHAAMPISEDVPSIDLQLYAIGERKDRQIKRVERIMKQSAVDCVIHYKRNVRQGGDFVDGSPQCDYDVCIYECAAPPLPGIDDDADLVATSRAPRRREPSTRKMPVRSPAGMTTVLARRDVEKTMSDIVDYLQIHTRARLAHVSEVLGVSMLRATSAAYTLEREARVVLDRFGFPCVVRCLDRPVTQLVPRARGTTDAIVSLHRFFDFTEGQGVDPYDAYYTQTLHVSNVAIDIPAPTISGALTDSMGGALADRIERIGSNIKILETMPVPTQVELFELSTETLLRAASGEFALPAETARAVAWFFARYLYATSEPSEDLIRASEDLAKRGKGRGRKSRIDAPLQISFDVARTEVLHNSQAVVLLQKCSRNMGKCVDQKRVFIHTLNNKNVERTSYAVAAQMHGAHETIRVLAMHDRVPRWRDATLSEAPVYREILKNHHEKEIAEYGELYGSIYDDGKFRVHDLQSSKAGTARGEEIQRNRREEARGRVCTTWPPEHLVTLAYRAGVPSPPEAFVSASSHLKKARRDSDLVSFTKRPIKVVSAMPRDQSVYEHAWWSHFRFSGKKMKEAIIELCEQLRVAFLEKAKLLTV